MKPGNSFISQPVRSLQTMLRVLAEDDPMLPTVIPDGIYGPSTLGAVTAFQRRENLPLTGITDQRTWDKIAEQYEPALVRVGKAEPVEIVMDPGQVFVAGDESPYILLAQAILIWLARDYGQISPPASTAVLDQETEAALLAFQALAGLSQTGELDKVTWKHLSRHFTLNAHHNSHRNVISRD